MIFLERTFSRIVEIDKWIKIFSLLLSLCFYSFQMRAAHQQNQYHQLRNEQSIIMQLPGQLFIIQNQHPSQERKQNLHKNEKLLVSPIKWLRKSNLRLLPLSNDQYHHQQNVSSSLITIVFHRFSFFSFRNLSGTRTKLNAMPSTWNWE